VSSIRFEADLPEVSPLFYDFPYFLKVFIPQNYVYFVVICIFFQSFFVSQDRVFDSFFLEFLKEVFLEFFSGKDIGPTCRD
jgi:hypothetical protein